MFYIEKKKQQQIIVRFRVRFAIPMVVFALRAPAAVALAKLAFKIHRSLTLVLLAHRIVSGHLASCVIAMLA